MKPKSIRLYSRAVLMLLMMLLTTVTAWAETKTVNYIDADGTQKSVTATVLTGNETPNSSESIDLAAGWYVVNSDIEYTNTFLLHGEVHLILADAKMMSMSVSNTTHDGIYGASSFAIYGQTAGTGKLVINNSGNGCEGIRISEGTVTINGAIVEVQGTACGILAQDGITINGGNVTATTDGLYGLWAHNSTITLGWRSLSDRITVSEFNTSDHVVIADGKYFKDANNNYYFGTLTTAQKNALANVELIPTTEADYLSRRVTYIDADGMEQCITRYTELTGHETPNGDGKIELTPGWYVVKNTNTDANNDGGVDAKFTSPIVAKRDEDDDEGSINIILADGAEMVVNKSSSSPSIQCSYAFSLIIYGQSESTGKLTVNNNQAACISAYGGITINGGQVTTNRSIDANDKNITINGGQVSTNSFVTSGTISLGWRKASDRIYSYGYSYTSSVNVKFGQAFLTDGDTPLSICGGNVKIEDIRGKTLTPNTSSGYLPTKETVSYIDADGANRSVDAFVLTGNEPVGSRGWVCLGAGWYVVKNTNANGVDVNYTNPVAYTSPVGTVNIILADDAEMAVNVSAEKRGFFFQDTKYPLAIYGQSEGTGKLTVNTDSCDAIDAYGGLSIYGGIVSATSPKRYGIYTDGKNVNIRSGQVTANGGSSSYGISVRNSASENGTIILGYRKGTDFIYATSYRGKVKVRSGQTFFMSDTYKKVSGTVSSLTSIKGKTLRPYIDSSDNFEQTGTNEYTIKNSTGWNAFCVKLENEYTTYKGFRRKTVKLASDISVETMAGISSTKSFGGTFDGQGHTLTINYTSKKDFCAPFSYIQGESVTTVTIKNLHVAGRICTTDIYAGGLVGIVGEKSVLDITNCRSSVAITSILSGDDASISGYHGGFIGKNYKATTTIRGCVFDGELLSDGSKQTKSCGGFVGSNLSGSTLNVSNSLFAPAKKTVSTTGSKTFSRGSSGITVANSYYTSTLGTKQGRGAYVYTPATDSFVPANVGATIANGTYGVSGITAYTSGLKYNGKFYMVKANVSLANDADNSAAIANNQVADVTLSDRTLTKDGNWNTLCLPFSLTAEQIAASPLAGATIKEMATSSNLDNNGLLTLNFSTVTAIEAGTPYIIKWTTTGANIENPVFQGVTITSTTPESVTSTDGKVTFVGQYSPFSIVNSGATDSNEGNKDEIILMSSGNRIGYSQNSRTLKCFRCHFLVPTSGGQNEARSFVLDFGEGETTEIVSVTNTNLTNNTNDNWYTLDGRKLDGKPTTKGLYIVNGRKTVIK